jgi:type I restriction enzyme, S subunit
MKKGWQTKKLGEVCEMYQPKTISGKDMVEDGAYPVYGANGVIGRYNQFNHEEPQLLITCRGATCGSVNISAPRSWVTGNAMVVRPKNESLEMRYLEYLFRGGIDISKVITGAAQPQITRTNLEPLEISFPESLAEQQRIVGLLDEAFEGLATAKANAEKNLQNARALFESHLQSIFSQRGEGWVETKMSELYKIGSSKRVLKSEWKMEGVPFYRGREVTRLATYGFVNNELFISEDHFANLSKKYGAPETGDIVITAIGTIGNAHVVRSNDRFYFKDASILWMKRTADCSSDFIRFWLKSSLFFDQLDRGNGATVDTLTIQKLESVELRLPKLEEQKRIVVELDILSEQTQRLARIYEQKLVALEALKKSLLHQAFAGEL